MFYAMSYTVTVMKSIAFHWQINEQILAEDQKILSSELDWNLGSSEGCVSI